MIKHGLSRIPLVDDKMRAKLAPCENDRKESEATTNHGWRYRNTASSVNDRLPKAHD